MPGNSGDKVTVEGGHTEYNGKWETMAMDIAPGGDLNERGLLVKWGKVRILNSQVYLLTAASTESI